jgi:glyoxylase-like metal-dependent hydrolase (beta-lactamase superfamily II)
MDGPTMTSKHEVAPRTYEIASYFPVPTIGILPVNAFVIEGDEPVLVDTGLSALQDAFLASIAEVIDIERIRWIWLSHVDPDHTGNLAAVVERAPGARVITNFLGMGKMALLGLPLKRILLLEPGSRLDAGDRQLVPVHPPYYDAPETTGFFDTRTRALFTADAFGALLEEPADEARAIAHARLREGLATWSAVDSPWLAQTDRKSFAGSLSAITRLAPSVLLSSHLPSARGMTERLVEILGEACSRPAEEATMVGEIDRLLTIDPATP